MIRLDNVSVEYRLKSERVQALRDLGGMAEAAAVGYRELEDAGSVADGLRVLRAAPVDIEAFAAQLPMRRVGKPEDIAAAAAYLASEEAGYITGQVISTNGGRYMGSH